MQGVHSLHISPMTNDHIFKSIVNTVEIKTWGSTLTSPHKVSLFINVGARISRQIGYRTANFA